jgi:dUTP pyrophosphatase
MDTINNIPVKFIKLTKNAILPSNQKKGDAGYDLYATEHIKLQPMTRALVGTGLAIEIPEGYYGRIAPRSGLAVKNGIDVLAGVIDSNYRQELKVVLINLTFDLSTFSPFNKITGSSFDFLIRPGDRIAQIIFEKYYSADWQEVESLSSSDRTGGFGSTGV